MIEPHHITVFYYGAFLPIANGGNARFVPMLDRFVAEFDKVTLYSYKNHPDYSWTKTTEEDFRARWPQIDLILERYSSKLRLVTRVKNLLITLFPHLAERLIRVGVPGETPRFEAIKAKTSVFLVSYTEGLTQLNGVDPSRCVVETHDVNFIKWAKMRKARLHALTPLRKFRGEVATLETVKEVIAISPAETAFFKMMLPSPTVSYVPTWEAAAPVNAPQRGAKDFDLVFVGSEFIMNARGLCQLLATHGAWLAHYRIAICGFVCNNPDVIAAVSSFPNVSLLGFVERMEDVYARTKAALSPVDGTGTKMKIIYALGAGLPVFASVKSFEGLPPGHEGAVFEIDALTVETIMKSDTEMERATQRALVYFTQFNLVGDTSRLLSKMQSMAQSAGSTGLEDAAGG